MRRNGNVDNEISLVKFDLSHGAALHQLLLRRGIARRAHVTPEGRSQLLLLMHGRVLRLRSIGHGGDGGNLSHIVLRVQMRLRVSVRGTRVRLIGFGRLVVPVGVMIVIVASMLNGITTSVTRRRHVSRVRMARSIRVWWIV